MIQTSLLEKQSVVRLTPDETKVLLVEDEFNSLHVLQGHMKRLGLPYVCASNGIEALSKLREISEIKLVIADIMMPHMNGLELLKQIRADEALKGMPVIFASGRSDATCVRSAVQMGCVAYLIKPISFSKLKEQVVKTIQCVRTAKDPLTPDEIDGILSAF